ncbi:Bifunctional purine biosynthetic protein ade1 [Mycoemilia scoparia]|uniref:Phosphoribosylaminoimidazole-succinocarboxamide synthase n=1 Tax=Mycoemilia scoparia TaxID=417184 RepID=A0A9W8A3U3_9FUNG|nr:Bifunctional purine biosynthetic protein ade1 [Mycoemilia scoparia]
MPQPLLESDCPDLKLLARGKVRDLYDIDDDSLLFVATDRISAYDVTMKTPIPNKGRILTQMSVFWFKMLEDIIPNHMITDKIDEMPEKIHKYRDQLEGRSLLVKKVKILPVEAIVRGHIAGSGWKEYKEKETVCDIPLPLGLKESQKLSEPLYTPSTKAEYGEHDENIHPDKAVEILGKENADKVAKVSVEIYKKASDYAAKKGIIIADTKLEFGLDKQGNLVLADEVLTPDSSRFWPESTFRVGKSQDSYDKQYLRDYLESINFDKKTPIDLPPLVVDNSLKKYIEAFVKLTGTRPDLK